MKILSLESPLIPLDDCKSDIVRLNLNLPFPRSGDKTIGVRLGIMEQLARFAGMKKLIIGTSLETDIEDVGVSGVSGSGEAVASSSASAEADRKVECHPHDPGSIAPAKPFTWYTVKTHVERKKLVDSVSEQGGLHSVDLWAEALNKELKDALSDAGDSSLLATPQKDLIIGTGWSFALFEVYKFMNQEGLGPVLSFLIALGVGMAALKVVEGVNIAIEKRTETPYDWRLSFEYLFGIELDRYLLFKLMTSRAQLIEVINISDEAD